MSSFTTQKDEVSRQVAFRLGAWAETQDHADINSVIDYVSQDQSIGALALYDAATNTFYDVNGYNRLMVKHNQFWGVNQKRLGSDMRVANFCSFIDMMNAQKSYAMTFTDGPIWRFNSLDGSPRYPIFQFTRHKTDKYAILFPLDYKYMGIGSANLPVSLEEIDRPFTEKKDSIVWRGRISGTKRNELGIQHAKAIINQLKQSSSEIEFTRIIDLNTEYPRIRLAKMYGCSDKVDIKLVCDELRDVKWEYARQIIGERVSVMEQLLHKYILCMPGNDYPSGLYWALVSNSIVLMPEPEWETALDYALNPWTHYIPLSPSLDDLFEKLDWCRNNEEKLSLVNKNAKSYVRSLCDPAIRDRADINLIQRYENMSLNTPIKNTVSFATNRQLSKTRLK